MTPPKVADSPAVSGMEPAPQLPATLQLPLASTFHSLALPPPPTTFRTTAAPSVTEPVVGFLSLLQTSGFGTVLIVESSNQSTPLVALRKPTWRLVAPVPLV